MPKSLNIAGAFLALGVLSWIPLAAWSATPAYEARVDRVLAGTPLIDGHNDLPWEIRSRFKGDLVAVDLKSDTARLPFPPDSAALMSDIPRLRTGHVGGQFWSVWVPVNIKGFEVVQTTLEQIDLVKRMCARYPDDLAMAYSAADVRRIHQSHKVACLIGIEGGHQINDSLGVLRQMYDAGARYRTLTHTTNTDWADSATDTPAHHGLTPFGEEVVREMNRLGMLVDLSHVSDATMVDAIRVSRAPVFYSHSSARALCNHVRNVPDSILKMVRTNGGVVMVNFNPGFVSEAVRVYEDSMARRARALRAAGVDTTAVADSLKGWAARGPKATLSQVADHIEHIRDVAGVDAVGLGSDFDGITEVPVGLEDVSKFPDLLAELLRRGWNEQDIRKVAGLNALRVLRAAEGAASKQ